MDINAIIRNIKNKGIGWTWNYFIGKKRFKKVQADYSKYYMDRSFLSLNDEKKKIFYKQILDIERDLKKNSPHVYDQYLKDMKRVYIKERIPQLYKEASKHPISDKVIFLEIGKSPSPSNSHISKVMMKEGKYEVHMIGLHMRSVSFVEFYENALEFIEDMATAKAVFLSTANDLLSCFEVRPETKVIQLWHGVGMLKKVGYSTLDSKKFGMSHKTRSEYDQYRNYSYVTIASPEQTWMFEDAMNINRESGIIVPVGIARTDVFYDPNYIEKAYNKLYDKIPQIKGKKIILYAPTFRGEVADAKAPDQLNISAFAKHLSNEYVLLIKHHSLSKDIPPIPDQWKDRFAFDMNEKKILNIEQLLVVADICITDYSSIAFEYAIMEKQLIFYAYDLEDYIDERGLYCKYDEITPGSICKTNEEMISYITNIDSSFAIQEVIDFKNKFVSACDGNSTSRTIALIVNGK